MNETMKQSFVLIHSMMAMVFPLGLNASEPAATPASTRVAVSQTEKVALPPLKEIKSIAVVGDSLSDGYGVDPDKAYPALLERKLAQAGFKVKVTNSSISGSTSASAVRRAEWVLKSKPDLLIVALGANDGLRGLDPKITEKNIAAAVRAAQAKKVPTVIAGMKMPPNYGKAYTEAFESTFKNAAAATGAPLLPFLLEGVGGEKSLNQADGIHPNEKGHEKMATLVFDFLKRTFK